MTELVYIKHMPDENQIEDVEDVIVSNVSEAATAEDEKEEKTSDYP